MAKKATGKAGSAKPKGAAKSQSKSRAIATRRDASSGERSSSDTAGEAFIRLLQSPLVAELVAVAATAALASLAENGYAASRDGSRGKRAGKAVKAAGKAAASAVGRRLGNEIDEIRKAAKAAKVGAKA